MKKLLLILAIGAFVACNDSGNEEGTVTDTTVTPTPDTSSVTPLPDTTGIDTTGRAGDTTRPQ
jgi:hypothetical protein